MAPDQLGRSTIGGSKAVTGGGLPAKRGRKYRGPYRRGIHPTLRPWIWAFAAMLGCTDDGCVWSRDMGGGPGVRH